MKYHRWTKPKISFIAEAWSRNLSANRIADELLTHLGIVVSSNAVLAIARRNRDLMPEKTPEMCSQAMRAAERRDDRRAA